MVPSSSREEVYGSIRLEGPPRERRRRLHLVRAVIQGAADLTALLSIGYLRGAFLALFLHERDPAPPPVLSYQNAMTLVRFESSRGLHRGLRFAAIAAAFLLSVRTAGATDIALFDWGISLDGTSYCDLGPCDFDGTLPGDLPPSIDASLFDFDTGLGEIAVSISGAGSRQVSLFLDIEIDEPANTFFNEWGAAAGVPPLGQTWEIDEPGYVFGDIHGNWLDDNLDGVNGVPAALPDDVSLAIAWDFLLSPGMGANVSFLVSETAPSSGFYLIHTDPDSARSIYFSSLLVTSGTPDVPEPLTAPLLIGAVVGLVVARKGRKKVL